MVAYIVPATLSRLYESIANLVSAGIPIQYAGAYALWSSPSEHLIFLRTDERVKKEKKSVIVSCGSVVRTGSPA